MNIGKNQKKSLENTQTFITYLLINKKRFLINNKHDYMYFNHKKIMADLNWSQGKTYTVFNECVGKKLISLVTGSWCTGKYSRVFNISQSALLNFELPDYPALLDNSIKNNSSSTKNNSNNETYTKYTINKNNISQSSPVSNDLTFFEIGDDATVAVAEIDIETIATAIDNTLKETDKNNNKSHSVLSLSNDLTFFENSNAITGDTAIANTLYKQTDQFINKKIKPYSKYTINKNNISKSSPVSNDLTFFEMFNYGTQYKKSLNFINPYLTTCVDIHGQAEIINPVCSCLVEKINATNRSACEYIRFNEKLCFTKPNIRYKIKKSCRASSYLCNSDKIYLRPLVMKKLNLNYQFDIPSAVPALFRLLNNDYADFNENLKLTIINNAGLANVISETEFKPVLFRLLFNKSCKQSLSHAAYASRNNLLLRKLLPCWKILYDETHNLVGDTSLQSEIFKYESILELRTVLALRESGYYTSNIYDCFYSEAPTDIIKNELTRQSHILYDDYANSRL